MEKEKIKFGIDSIFHMIRHFEHANQNDIAKLKSAGYSDLLIEEENLRPGSKFFFSYATSIDNLLDKLKFDKFQIIKSDNKKIQLLFTEENPIGTNVVVKFDFLSEQQKRKVYLNENRGYDIKHLEVTDIPITNNWTMVLMPQKNNTYHFITAFPGEISMPIPLSGMSKELKDKCINYWDNHIFLIKNSKLNNKLFS
jgi:hypothetical protein